MTSVRKRQRRRQLARKMMKTFESIYIACPCWLLKNIFTYIQIFFIFLSLIALHLFRIFVRALQHFHFLILFQYEKCISKRNFFASLFFSDSKKLVCDVMDEWNDILFYFACIYTTGNCPPLQFFCMFKTDFAKFLHFNTFDKDTQNAFWDKHWLLSIWNSKSACSFFCVLLFWIFLSFNV